jgi:Carboxylesterase family
MTQNMNPILYLVVASAALSAAQLPTLPPGWTLPPGLTLPSSLPPLEDIWPRPVVDVPGYGKIRGGTAHSWYTGKEYNFFHGVYYAKPTTSETRFLVSDPQYFHFEYFKFTEAENPSNLRINLS